MNYIEECKRIINTYPDQIKRIRQNPDCEIEHDFLGFLNSYYDLSIPENFTIIDFGCGYAIQSVYFKSNRYIGIDYAVPIESRFTFDNVTHYYMSIQNYINNILPTLNLDFNKTFAISSYVPDKEARKLIKNTFIYYRDQYCSDIEENLP